MDFKFQRKRIDKFTESKILNELERAAEHFQYIEFSKRNFTKFTGMSITPIQNQYGSWKNGLAALRNHLQQKGLDLSPRPYAPQRIYSDKDLFEEMGRIWQKVGQRPSKTEWEAAEPKISITAYKNASEAGQLHVNDFLNIKWVKKYHLIILFGSIVKTIINSLMGRTNAPKNTLEIYH